MANAPARSDTPTPSTIENVLMRGDLSDLTEQQRLEYYNRVCESVGLNPLTRPFEYLHLQGKLQLYARRDAADQLRKLNGISIEVLREHYDRGMLSVHVRATDKSGRTDEDYGVVPWNEKAAPEFAANIKMKAITKAKRRVTLSISGLGWLDETEVEDIPEEQKRPIAKHRQPESGPNMTRAEAIGFSSKLLRAIQAAEKKEHRQDACDMAHDEMMRMKRDQPEVYDRLVSAIDKEMADHE